VQRVPGLLWFSSCETLQDACLLVFVCHRQLLLAVSFSCYDQPTVNVCSSAAAAVIDSVLSSCGWVSPMMVPTPADSLQEHISRDRNKLLGGWHVDCVCALHMKPCGDAACA
jgi:hypothetical protein